MAPLVLALMSTSRPGQGFWTDFSVALGFVGLALMGIEFALVARVKTVAEPFGTDAVIDIHRQIGNVGLLFVLIHVALSADWSQPTYSRRATRPPRCLSGRRQRRRRWSWWQVRSGVVGSDCPTSCGRSCTPCSQRRGGRRPGARARSSRAPRLSDPDRVGHERASAPRLPRVCRHPELNRTAGLESPPRGDGAFPREPAQRHTASVCRLARAHGLAHYVGGRPSMRRSGTPGIV